MRKLKIAMRGIFEDDELRRRFMRTPEGHIFVAGSWGVVLWLFVIVALWRTGHPRWNDLLIMGFTQLTVGRPGGIAFATNAGMPKLIITFLSVYIDMLTVFIVYPVLIFFYVHFFGTPFFQRRLKPIFDSAQRNLSRVAKFQIVGLFFFVWSPFWMTGVVVGAVLGYLMGLKTWVTMITVGAGTTAAIVCWVYANDVFFGWLSTMPSWVPQIVVLAIILLLAGLRFTVLMRARRKTALKAVAADSDEAQYLTEQP